MVKLIVALVNGDASVLDFDEVDEARGVGVVNLTDDDDQSIRDELDTELEVLLSRHQILGWGTDATLFTVEGDATTYTLANMVEVNRDEETGEDWITAELLALRPGDTGRVGMQDVTRAP